MPPRRKPRTTPLLVHSGLQVTSQEARSDLKRMGFAKLKQRRAASKRGTKENEAVEALCDLMAVAKSEHLSHRLASFYPPAMLSLYPRVFQQPIVRVFTHCNAAMNVRICNFIVKTVIN